MTSGTGTIGAHMSMTGVVMRKMRSRTGGACQRAVCRVAGDCGIPRPVEAVDRALPEPSAAPVDREAARGRVRATPEIAARLVERYLGITRWPTSKKTALTLSIALPAHLVLSTFAVYEARQFGDGLDT